MGDLAGRTAIVTGSTRGIGRAIAQALVDVGCNVVVSSRHEEAAREAADQLGGRGGRALGVACDVQHLDQCEAMVAACMKEFGRLDILVNNAGIGAFASVNELDPATWRSIIGTNLDGVFYCTHAALPHLRAARGAWIINIASLAGKHASPGGAAYNASKFGLVGFSEAIMQDVRYDDIRVSYIMPGSVATEFAGHDVQASKDAWKIQPEDVAKIVMDLLSMDPRTLPSRVEVRPSRPPKK